MSNSFIVFMPCFSAKVGIHFLTATSLRTASSVPCLSSFSDLGEAAVISRWGGALMPLSQLAAVDRGGFDAPLQVLIDFMLSLWSPPSYNACEWPELLLIGSASTGCRWG